MIAILDPFSGIAGDMMLGALVDAGLDPAFLQALPGTLGIEGVAVRIARVQRAGIGGVKVDFDVPPQPHGRHLKHILEIVERTPAPASVKHAASEAFRLIAGVEAEVHGITVERVHLHEVGAVDAILDIVGSVWGVHLLGIADMRCGTIAVGDGFVNAAHGRMPVPAPATARLLEGWPVSAGPPGSGELTTPTGAALVRVMCSGGAPELYTARRTGYGAGTKDFEGRPNLLRITLADDLTSSAGLESLAMLAADIDDATPEYLAAAAESLRRDGALDVTSVAVIMKKGRGGTRLEVLARVEDADRLERAMFLHTTTIGVRRTTVLRRALPRRVTSVRVLEHSVEIKWVDLPDGTTRGKPSLDDLNDAALATGRPIAELSSMAMAAAHQAAGRV